MTRYYTGVGSRETPPDVLGRMTKIARYLDGKGFTLRSGHAPGADTAFEDGARAWREIWLPWRGFNGSKSPFFPPHPDAIETAKRHHPAWSRCSYRAQLLHGRNAHQVLGADLQTPSEFVICWTKDGGPTGGTGTAIRIATASKIPVFNLFHGLDDLKAHFEKIGIWSSK